MLYAVIMAGGSGTRFWPASRNDQPKQLLRLAGQRSMLQQTIDRIKNICDLQKSLIVTNRRLVAAIGEQLPELPADAIIGEPCKRDTAPCIGVAAAWLACHDPEATMLVMPADHMIETDEDFHRAVGQAAQEIERDPNCIVTFGIPPTYPAEVFGYIEREAETENRCDDFASYRVKRFREKPGPGNGRAVSCGRWVLLELRHLCLEGADRAERAAKIRTRDACSYPNHPGIHGNSRIQFGIRIGVCRHRRKVDRLCRFGTL